jgi:hypothetical protein
MPRTKGGLLSENFKKGTEGSVRGLPLPLSGRQGSLAGKFKLFFIKTCCHGLVAHPKVVKCHFRIFFKPEHLLGIFILCCF